MFYLRIIGRLLLLAVLVASLSMFLLTFRQLRGPQLYKGVTRVMERQPGPEQGVPVYDDKVMNPNLAIHMNEMWQICWSQTVMTRATDMLREFNISVAPEDFINTVKIEPVADTGILQISVTSESPEEAKLAADVIAAEFRRFHNEITHSATMQSREFIEKQLKDSAKHLIAAQRQLASNRSESKVIAEIDAKVAAETYARLKAKLDEAKIKERESINSSTIKIVEPAYYARVDRNTPQNMLWLLGYALAFLFSGWAFISVVRSKPVNKSQDAPHSYIEEEMEAPSKP